MRKSREAVSERIAPMQPSDRLRLARALRLIRANAADSFLAAKPDGFDGWDNGIWKVAGLRRNGDRKSGEFSQGF